jgi:hypothetical protein
VDRLKKEQKHQGTRLKKIQAHNDYLIAEMKDYKALQIEMVAVKGKLEAKRGKKR